MSRSFPISPPLLAAVSVKDPGASRGSAGLCRGDCGRASPRGHALRAEPAEVGRATWKPSQDPDATPRIESRGTRPPTPAVEAPGGAPLSWLEGRLSGQSSVCPALGVSKTPRRSGSSEEDTGLTSASFSSDLPHRYPRRAGAPRPTSATRSARPSVTWGRAPWFVLGLRGCGPDETGNGPVCRSVLPGPRGQLSSPVL